MFILFMHDLVEGKTRWGNNGVVFSANCSGRVDGGRGTCHLRLMRSIDYAVCLFPKYSSVRKQEYCLSDRLCLSGQECGRLRYFGTGIAFYLFVYLLEQS